MKTKIVKLLDIIGGTILLGFGIYGLLGFDRSIYSIFSIIAGVVFIIIGLCLQEKN